MSAENNTPIGASVENDMPDTAQFIAAGTQGNGGNTEYPDWRAQRKMQEVPQPNPIRAVPDSGPADDVLAQLVDAQQELISAQHGYFHNRDKQALLRAQSGLLFTQDAALRRLGAMG